LYTTNVTNRLAPAQQRACRQTAWCQPAGLPAYQRGYRAVLPLDATSSVRADILFGFACIFPFNSDNAYDVCAPTAMNGARVLASRNYSPTIRCKPHLDAYRQRVLFAFIFCFATDVFFFYLYRRSSQRIAFRAYKRDIGSVSRARWLYPLTRFRDICLAPAAASCAMTTAYARLVWFARRMVQTAAVLLSSFITRCLAFAASSSPRYLHCLSLMV